MTRTETYHIELFPLEKVRPTEEYFKAHSENLRSEIEITGIWTHPLLVDRNSHALMDGHHRYHAARALGLTAVPVIQLSYDDPAVTLLSWRPGQTYTPEMIREICESGVLLPMKSTRHIVNAQLPFSRVALERLKTADHLGELVTPASPHPSRAQILSDDYHAFGRRMAMRTISAAKIDLETSSTIVPHSHLRQTLEADPAMAALLPGAPCRIALGTQEDFPFRLKRADILLLPPSLLSSQAALSAAARWGMEAAFALQAGGVGPRRLTALIRHGAALIRQLKMEDRALLLSAHPGGICAELARASLDPPSQALLDWQAGLMGLGAASFAHQTKDTPAVPLSLEAPVERILVSNGDSRLKVDPQTGKNRYGTTPRPRPEAVHFSSSTASSISDYGFLFCDVLRRDLLNHLLDAGHGVHETRAALANAITDELRDMCGLDESEADGVIAPSGTDTEVLAVLLARAAAPEEKLVNILLSPEETGRGVKLAGAGCYFDPMSATGAKIEMGQEIWPGAEIGLVAIGIRDDNGDRLPIETLDKIFLEAGKSALESGARVLAHVLIGSKTGLSGPSDAAVDELVALAPDRVDVVVDACQMRVDFARLGECLHRGWMVQVSGSKSLTGPPFSGGMLLPLSLRDRAEMTNALMRPGVGYAEDWSAWWAERLDPSPSEPAFGVPFRWIPALMEAKLNHHVPQALHVYVLDRFREEVTERLTRSDCFMILPRVSDAATTLHAQSFARHSIVSFQILARQWDGSQMLLDEPSCRKIFELLNQDAQQLISETSQAIRSVLSQEFHIGQPVVLGKGDHQRALLRLVLGMRFYNIVGHAGPGSIAAALDSEISDLIRAVDKLEILAENWWRYNDDIL